MGLFKLRFFLLVWSFLLPIYKLPAQNNPKTKEEVVRLHNLGIDFSNQNGGWLAALSYFGDALRIAREIDYKNGEADILRSIADLESRAPYRNDEALEYLLMELRVRQEIGDPTEIARTYVYIGDFFQKRFHLHEEAIAYFRQAITILKTRDTLDEDVLITAWKKIADAYAFVEDMPRYFAANDSLLAFYKSIDALQEASDLSLEISKQQASLENLEKSLEYAQEGKRYYSLTIIESEEDQNENLEEFDHYLNSLKKKKETKERKQKGRRSIILLLFLIPLLIASWFIWKYLYKKSNKN